MGNIAGVGFVLMGIGALLCFANSGGFVKFMKLRNPERHGVAGEAVSDLQEWISSGHRVYYHIRIPGAPPQDAPPHFIEVGPELRGPTGTIVSAVYDARNPKRARTGLRKDLDFEKEWPVVLLLGGGGLVLFGVGVLLCVIGAVV
ncbi:hypothetical protein [Streptomyces sp. NPDC101455]|uniref:hypothetical protein n=1 Tax=Streptomyces sp. NPDC101455 TaxID=3366142 RepID=UPI0037FB4B39